MKENLGEPVDVCAFRGSFAGHCPCLLRVVTCHWVPGLLCPGFIVSQVLCVCNFYAIFWQLSETFFATFFPNFLAHTQIATFFATSLQFFVAKTVAKTVAVKVAKHFGNKLAIKKSCNKLANKVANTNPGLNEPGAQRHASLRVCCVSLVSRAQRVFRVFRYCE